MNMYIYGRYVFIDTTYIYDYYVVLFIHVDSIDNVIKIVEQNVTEI